MSEAPITAKYGMLDTAILQMRTLSHGIDDKLDALRKDLTQVQWVGFAQTSWAFHQQQWDEAVTELNGLLQLIVQKVGRAKENYITTENEVAREWRNAELP
jgi:WXG100 family type VII secretion target